MMITGELMKVGSQFVCWNSFKSEFFLGAKHLSEIFSWSPFRKESRRIEAEKLYPNYKIVRI